MWLYSLKVAQLLRSAARLHTNQSRSYLNHLVHAKKFLLQTLVTPINTLYILYLSMPRYVLSSYLLNVHMEVLLLLNIFVNINHLQNLQDFKIYRVHKPLKEFCVLV